MPITGRVDYTTAEILVGTPTGCWGMIGLDGNHYTQASNGSGAIQIGNAETNTLIANISDSQLLADVLSVTGVSGWSSSGILPVAGTPYIGMIMGNFSGEVYGVFYKINASSLLELEGGFYYKSATSPLGGFGDTGITASTLAIDGEVYFLISAGIVGSGSLEPVLAHVPYTGTNINATPGSWDTRATDTGLANPTVYGGRRYYNFVSLKDLDDGNIGVLAYYGTAEGGPQVVYNVVDTAGQAAGTPVDLSSDFQEVIDSVGTLYAGGPSGDAFDDFTAPYISGNQVIWARPYSDNIDTAQLIEYLMVDADNITYRQTRQISGFTITAVAGDLESVRVYRDGPSTILALVDRRYFYFAQFGGGRGGHTQIIGA